VWIAAKASYGFHADALLALSPVATNQAWEARREVMKEVFTASFKKPIRGVEIGTWFGRGSTKIWLNNIPEGSTLTLVDSWRKFLSSADAESSAASTQLMDAVPHSAIVSTLKEIYRHEASGKRVDVIVVRGKSAASLGQLKDRAFDFIYVDGSHYYADAKQDMADAKRLARDDFALVCGDDYELMGDEALLEIARKNLNHDFVALPNGPGFHPGVMLAIAEEFGQVNMRKGFWWIYRRNGQWSLV
jgi:predicted O-methyltransferase YrrM